MRLALTYAVVFCCVEVGNQQHPLRADFLICVWTLFFLTLLMSDLPQEPPELRDSTSDPW